MSSPCRLALFVMASAALLTVALLLGRGVTSPPRPVKLPRPVEPSVQAMSSRPTGPLVGGEAHGLTTSARRFLVAFTRYEVGDRRREVLEILRSTATRSFARALLREPLLASASTPAVAELGRLSVAVVSRRPLLASVGAVAFRPSGPEQLAFLFVRRDGAWLASAPGE
jgi:hypothetical protein